MSSLYNIKEEVIKTINNKDKALILEHLDINNELYNYYIMNYQLVIQDLNKNKKNDSLKFLFSFIEFLKLNPKILNLTIVRSISFHNTELTKWFIEYTDFNVDKSFLFHIAITSKEPEFAKEIYCDSLSYNGNSIVESFIFSFDNYYQKEHHDFFEWLWNNEKLIDLFKNTNYNFYLKIKISLTIKDF